MFLQAFFCNLSMSECESSSVYGALRTMDGQEMRRSVGHMDLILLSDWSVSLPVLETDSA